MNCPGSVQAEREVLPFPASDFSEAGTSAHKLFAHCLLEGLRPDVLTDDPVMLQPLSLALDLTREIIGHRRFMVELRLAPLTDLPSVWGTSDVVVFSREGPVDSILDLKFGEAIGVEADAVQLGIYGLLAARQFGVAPSGLTAWIVQPRHDHDRGPARFHHYSLDALDQLEAQLRQAAAATEPVDAPRHAGDWCRFCAAAFQCPVRQRHPDAVPQAKSAWFRAPPRWFAMPITMGASP
jgi:hypothetical protein